ncbi:hypothetical protein [Azovibrio restrictus]|uniref:hypothetical protein n=1 Tax=Azovibrio restrictus TaxID=146938 RepID=UPI0026EC205D|nr:hypothetical protein [Azovibrio restrictus]MDD3482818.1 hypothetical protein [Azovibrio restrictus]
MVKRRLLLTLASLFMVVAALPASANEGEAPKRRPLIKKVLIDENAAWSDKRSSSDETPENCASFMLKESDVQRFFKIARFSSSHEQIHDLEVSRCYATGRAVLQDGREATWLIDRARQGIFELDDGSALYFYCGKCSNRLYWSE